MSLNAPLFYVIPDETVQVTHFRRCCMKEILICRTIPHIIHRDRETTRFSGGFETVKTFWNRKVP
jgi:hypothetical protein